MAGLPRLPACRQCYQRKVKCDSRRPRCEACTKNDSECVFTDPATGEIVSRQELADLERNVQRLSGAAENESPQTQNGQNTSPEHEEGGGARVAQGSGLSFMSPLFNDQEWRQSNAYVLRSLANPSATADLNIEPNDLPHADEAKILFDSYLRSFHIHNPILLRQDVLALYDRMFPSITREDQPTKHDLFRTFMVLGLGSILLYRRGQHQHNPFGYYLSAMRNFDRFLIRDGLDPIQDLLLVMRFGIYHHHIGTSIWAMTRLCVRMCIEQGLHKRSDTLPCGGLLEEQMRRRVFWICYMMDRYSSITLNRPFAIKDSDIEVGLPVDTDDQYLGTIQSAPLKFDDLVNTSAPIAGTEMSAFVSCVKVRQISSRICRYFADTMNKQLSTRTGHDEVFLATGHIHIAVQRFLADLEGWRASAPVYEAPQCLFERVEWYDLLQAREAFHLFRRALDVAPKRNGAPSQSLLIQCQAAAARVIQLYSDLYAGSLATYTRSYFQMLFTAGLSLLYCISVLSRIDFSLVREGIQELERCRATLTDMVINLPDARHYVAVFEALFRHISQRLNHGQQRAMSSENNHAAAGLIPDDVSQQTSYPELVANENGVDRQSAGDQFPYTGHTYQRGEDEGVGINPMYDMPIPAVFGDGQNYLTAEGLSVFDSNMWNWDMLNDEALWNVGNYVVGDPSTDFGIFDPN